MNTPPTPIADGIPAGQVLIPRAVEPKESSAAKDLCRSLGITVAVFADRLGVSKRTLYKWCERGCPFTSEDAVRTWCQYEHITLKAPLDTFQDLRARVAPPISTPSIPAGGAVPAAGSPPVDPAVALTPKAILDASTTRYRDVQTEKAVVELDLLRKTAIHRDDVQYLAGEIGLTVVSELQDLPYESVRQLQETFPVELRRDVSRAVQAAVDLVREHLGDSIRDAVNRVLKSP